MTRSTGPRRERSRNVLLHDRQSRSGVRVGMGVAGTY